MQNSVGQPLTRVDGRAKVTGRATYAAEHKVPSLAHGVLVMSTIAKGSITSIDTAPAQRSPGVLGILTHLTAPRLPQLKSIPPNARKVQLLQDNQVLYANQPIGLVVADTLENAQRAVSLVVVRYTPARH